MELDEIQSGRAPPDAREEDDPRVFLNSFGMTPERRDCLRIPKNIANLHQLRQDLLVARNSSLFWQNGCEINEENFTLVKDGDTIITVVVRADLLVRPWYLTLHTATWCA